MQIGYFQFDNLVKNKVPFTLINFDINTEEIYQGHHNSHLERCIWRLPHPYQGKGVISKMSYNLLGGHKKLIQEFKSKEFPLQQALVVLCSNGQLAKDFHKEIEKLGYLNAFWVEGGWNKIKADSAMEKL